MNKAIKVIMFMLVGLGSANVFADDHSVNFGEKAFADLKAALPAVVKVGKGGEPSDSPRDKVSECKITVSYSPDGNSMSMVFNLEQKDYTCTLAKNDPKFREDEVGPSRFFGNSDHSETHFDPHGCRIGFERGAYIMINFDSGLMGVCVVDEHAADQ